MTTNGGANTPPDQYGERPGLIPEGEGMDLVDQDGTPILDGPGYGDDNRRT